MVKGLENRSEGTGVVQSEEKKTKVRPHCSLQPPEMRLEQSGGCSPLSSN